MKNNIILAIFSILFLGTSLSAQSFYFGPRGGLAIGFQNWNNLQRDPLIAFQGDFFIESYDEFGKGALFAMAGYHTRGSATRLINPFNNFNFKQGFAFNNVVLTVGAKKKINFDRAFRPYYQVGLRAEYTVSTNLDELSVYQSIFYPIEALVNKFNYGLNLGGGFEYEIDETIIGFIDINLAPDISFQYKQGAIPNVINPYTGQPTTLSEREIRNFTIEISFGMKFLRKVIYVD